MNRCVFIKPVFCTVLPFARLDVNLFDSLKDSVDFFLGCVLAVIVTKPHMGFANIKFLNNMSGWYRWHFYHLVSCYAAFSLDDTL